MAYGYGFASVYDLFFSEEERAERAGYYLSLISRNGVDGGILLDLACGTGALTPYYIDRGYDVIAVDVSEDMLSIARSKLGSAGERVLFLCQDMRSLDLYGTVRCAVSSLDSMNHLLTENELLEAFSRVSLFTEPGGVFVFDMNTVEKHRDILGDRSFIFETENTFLTWQNELDPATDEVEMLLDIFTKRKDGAYDRCSETVTERAYPPDSIVHLLKKAGFRHVETYSDLSLAPPKQGDERICFAAIK